MVARGDLGVEMGAATGRCCGKRIILRCLESGSQITATQMLD